MLSSKRCALHWAFSSFMWDNTQGRSTKGHLWAPKQTQDSSSLVFSHLMLQDYDQDVCAPQKTVTFQFNHLIPSHNHSICDWVWLSPEKLLLTLGLPSGKSNFPSTYALLMSELVQPNCFLSLEGQDHAWPQVMHTPSLQQALLLLTMNTALCHYRQLLQDLCNSHLPTDKVMPSQALKTILKYCYNALKSNRI